MCPEGGVLTPVTHTCENITFPQLRNRAVHNHTISLNKQLTVAFAVVRLRWFGVPYRREAVRLVEAVVTVRDHVAPHCAVHDNPVTLKSVAIQINADHCKD